MSAQDQEPRVPCQVLLCDPPASASPSLSLRFPTKGFGLIPEASWEVEGLGVCDYKRQGGGEDTLVLEPNPREESGQGLGWTLGLSAMRAESRPPDPSMCISLCCGGR